jgi:hypothetical protein
MTMPSFAIAVLVAHHYYYFAEYFSYLYAVSVMMTTSAGTKAFCHIKKTMIQLLNLLIVDIAVLIGVLVSDDVKIIGTALFFFVIFVSVLCIFFVLLSLSI